MELSKKSIRLLQKAVKGKKKKLQSVLVCTDKRGVVFGYTKHIHADPIKLKNARMCLYWPETIGGVFGLGDIGPNAETRISAAVPSITLPGITAVFSVTDDAENAWNNAPVQGR